MANVLMGIVGVVLFIGMALAGASFFGPVMGDAVLEGRANGLIQVLSTTAGAVSVRNRELETTTTGSINSNILFPDYVDDVPSNPVNGWAVMLLTVNGMADTGLARIVGSKLGEADVAMCSYIDKLGGGAGIAINPATGQATNPLAGVVAAAGVVTMPSQPMGCARIVADVGPFSSGDLFAYMTIN